MNKTDKDPLGLSELPLATPAATQWDAIAARGVAAGLVNKPGFFDRPRHMALAASVLLACAIALFWPEVRDASMDPQFSATPPPTVDAITKLQRQNVLYERALRLVPVRNGVVPASRASRETALADRISAIDHRLTQGGSALSERDRTLLWSERAMLLKALVQLRYPAADAQYEF